MVTHDFNPSTQEAEAGRGQPGLQSEFQDSQGYTHIHTHTHKPVSKNKKEKSCQGEINNVATIKQNQNSNVSPLHY